MPHWLRWWWYLVPQLSQGTKRACFQPTVGNQVAAAGQYTGLRLPVLPPTQIRGHSLSRAAALPASRQLQSRRQFAKLVNAHIVNFRSGWGKWRRSAISIAAADGLVDEVMQWLWLKGLVHRAVVVIDGFATHRWCLARDVIYIEADK